MLKMANKNLNEAKKAKNDEFYTMLRDIEKELKHYRKHLKNKVVFCNCDNPEESNFWRYFKMNFDFLGLNKLISTHYKDDKSTYKLEYDGENIIKTNLKQNGDFRSPETIEILKESDVVITNPPFSLFREYVAQLIEYDKDFLIIGSLNATKYKEIFPLIKKEKMWMGVKTSGFKFLVPNEYNSKKTYLDDRDRKYVKIGNVTWYTNLDNERSNEDLILYKEYNEKDYIKYDNYDAINVNKTKEIPKDYYKPMGVPISFLCKHSKGQFKIMDKLGNPCVNEKNIYSRIIIQRKDVK